MSLYADLFKTTPVNEHTAGPVDNVEGEGLQQKIERFTLLFVDDETFVLQALKRVFLDENYEILTAGSTDEAVNVMEASKVQLVISDYRMPGQSGAELLS